jgi:hypothetical protein
MKKNTPLAEYTMLELEALAKKAAEAFKGTLADDFNLTKYKNFLNAMYHYTAQSEKMISHARDLSPNDELHHYLDHMVKEEHGHYILAREDLKELGEKVSNDIHPIIQDFHTKWFQLGENVYSYLGAIYVFENIAKYVQTEGKSLYDKLGINKKQRRWLSVHLEADLSHGDEIIEIAQKYVHKNPEEFLRGGNAMCTCWINVFTHALS